ncbi:MAG: hypothetical protein V4635_01145 [Bacteroidota bacterium]
MKFKVFIISIILLSSCPVFSQTLNGKRTEIEDADEHFNQRNYPMAIPVYKVELKKDPENIKIKYKLGICYLNTRINYSQSITYLEDYAKDPKADEEVYFFLGRAYHLNNKLTEAIAAYKKFEGLRPKRAAEVERYIGQCESAIKLMRKPTNISFQNMGKEINSDEPDYYPFINKNETVLAFTSRRKDNVGGKKFEIDGYRSSDIYLSTSENGAWTPAKNAGRTINSSLDEQVVGLKSDALEMYIYLDHIDKSGDIYVTNRKDLETEFPKPKIFLPGINDFFETSGCLSEDGNILFFARRMKQGEQSDLYLCRKLPNGTWAIPQKLPDHINTPHNEESPYLSYDCQTLYFASEGHNSMGGYDLFKSKWDQTKNTFSAPVNMGYPINSADDDRSICVTEDNRIAYISAFRPNGYGDLDIYRIRFNEAEQKTKIYKGRIFLGDTIVKNQPKTYNATIIATNQVDDMEYTFTPQTKTGKFMMSLPAGIYKVTVTSSKYETIEEKLVVSDIGTTDVEVKKNYLLKIKY